MSVLQVPDLVEEIVAWRAWRAVFGDPRRDGHVLVSFNRVEWPAGDWLHATCKNYTVVKSNEPRPYWRLDSSGQLVYLKSPPLASLRPEPCGDDSPGERCRCGIYAVSTRWQLQEEVNRLFGDAAAHGVLVGKVALAGKVIEHQGGYRAQRARPLELHLDAFHVPLSDIDTGGLLIELARRYRLPLLLAGEELIPAQPPSPPLAAHLWARGKEPE